MEEHGCQGGSTEQLSATDPSNVTSSAGRAFGYHLATLGTDLIPIVEDYTKKAMPSLGVEYREGEEGKWEKLEELTGKNRTEIEADWRRKEDEVSHIRTVDHVYKQA